MAKRKTKKKEFRSSLEALVSFLLQGSKVQAEYEDKTLPFVQPMQKRRYNPDFRIPATTLSASSPEIFLEVKGHLTSSDRKKLKLIKEQYPNLILILIFGRSCNKLNKARSTTYGDWADQYGIPWLDVKEIQEHGDIKECLLSLMKKHKSGKFMNLQKRRSKALSQLEKGLSSTD